jgi:hypothetical protein
MHYRKVAGIAAAAASLFATVAAQEDPAVSRHVRVPREFSPTTTY